MSPQEILLEEIKHQPEPVLREVLHYLKSLASVPMKSGLTCCLRVKSSRKSSK